MIFLGCDAGSTKSEFIVADERGNLLAHRVFPACSYIREGHERFERTMRGCLREVYAMAGVPCGAMTYSVFGLTGYGEMKGMEQGVPRALGEFAPPMHSEILNDAVVGFSGSLGGQPGINVVSGTGSIVYGEDALGKRVRVGGWSLLFDDEGSCCWLGRQALAAFFRQADGRAPRTPLYDLVLRHYGVQESLHVVGELRGLETRRAELAQLQRLAEQAAIAGDESMERLYALAARKLMEQAAAVQKQLYVPPGETLAISYSGGLFKSGERVLAPFRRGAQALGLRPVDPLYPPYIGALALAAKQYLGAGALSAALKKAHKAAQTV